MNDPNYTPTQRLAYAHFRQQCIDAEIALNNRLLAIESRLKALPAQIQALDISWLKTRPLALHFHPDRPTRSGQMIIEALLDDGLYRSQFETGLSNGGLTAHPGGARFGWEARLFKGAYDENTPAEQRPKYGALDLWGNALGPAPRFGSCYFRLNYPVLDRTTLCYGDSYAEPSDFATWDLPLGLWIPLLEDYLGEKGALWQVAHQASEHLNNVMQPISPRQGGMDAYRSLDDYIEAQVHGPIRLQEDVAALVVDGSFQGQAIEIHMRRLCEKYDIALEWHGGLQVNIHQIPSDFRGETVLKLGRRVAEDGHIHTALLGRLAKQLREKPTIWADLGTPDTLLQQIKYLWHILVRYGHAYLD